MKKSVDVVCGNLFLVILVVLLDLNWYCIVVLNMFGRWKVGLRLEDGVWVFYWYSVVYKLIEFILFLLFLNKV